MQNIMTKQIKVVWIAFVLMGSAVFNWWTSLNTSTSLLLFLTLITINDCVLTINEHRVPVAQW